MATLDDNRTGSEGGDMPKVEVSPPPPPPSLQQFLSLALAVLALATAFVSWRYCIIFTALALVVNVVLVTSLRGWEKMMPSLQIPPPPPPPTLKILLIVLPLLALAGALFQSRITVVIFTALTVALDVAVFAAVRAWSRNAEKAAAARSRVG